MNDRTPLADDILAIDFSSKVAQDFGSLQIQRGYPSINEYMLDALREESASRREVRLREIGSRMFPRENGS